MVNGWFWYSRFHSYLFTGHSSVSLQNGSNYDHQCVVCASSRPTSVPCRRYCLDLDKTFETNVNCATVSPNFEAPHTFCKQFINFCRWTAQSFNSGKQYLIQYCNPTWSNLITNFKWFYTENKHNLLCLKYTNEECKVQTTNQYTTTCVGIWSGQCLHSVHCFWHQPCN